MTRPTWGRWSPAQVARLGGVLGSMAYLVAGPVVVLVRLPRWLSVQDASLAEVNAHLRRVAALQNSVSA